MELECCELSFSHSSSLPLFLSFFIPPLFPPSFSNSHLLLILLDQISNHQPKSYVILFSPLFLAAANTCVWIVCGGICG